LRNSDSGSIIRSKTKAREDSKYCSEIFSPKGVQMNFILRFCTQFDITLGTQFGGALGTHYCSVDTHLTATNPSLSFWTKVSHTMTPTYLSALVAFSGSVIAGLMCFFAAWSTQHRRESEK
jgi:hypothetical protein